MKKRAKKLIAPIIIACCIAVYCIFIGAGFFFGDNISGLKKFLCLIITTAVIGVCIFTLRERINEIRSGEEDDISKY